MSRAENVSIEYGVEPRPFTRGEGEKLIQEAILKIVESGNENMFAEIQGVSLKHISVVAKRMGYITTGETYMNKVKFWVVKEKI